MESKPKKPTSYQKLKAENAKLIQDIYTLVMEKDPMKVLPVEMPYRIKFKTQDLAWSGSPAKKEGNTFNGSIKTTEKQQDT